MPKGRTTIKDCLIDGQKKLCMAGISSSRLDNELILSIATQLSREYLLAHDEDYLDNQALNTYKDLIEKRCRRIPLAYLLGYRQFYGRNFTVNRHTLIPRPETEQLIKIAIDLAHQEAIAKVADIGTGSGCLAITLGLELPQLAIMASDISSQALTVAQKNATDLNAKNINFIESNLWDNFLENNYDLAIANLPYVDSSWTELANYPELEYEPPNALYASDQGLAIIKELIETSPNYLKENGYLLIEMDPRQRQSIYSYAQKYHYQILIDRPFAILMQLKNTTKAKQN